MLKFSCLVIVMNFDKHFKLIQDGISLGQKWYAFEVLIQRLHKPV
jgi:hypothetical protein